MADELEKALRGLKADPQDREALARARALVWRQAPDDLGLRARLATAAIIQDPQGSALEGPPMLANKAMDWQNLALQLSPNGRFVHVRALRRQRFSRNRVFDFQIWDRRASSITYTNSLRFDDAAPPPRLVFSADSSLALFDHPGNPALWCLLLDLETRATDRLEVDGAHLAMAVARSALGILVALRTDDQIRIYRREGRDDFSVYANQSGLVDPLPSGSWDPRRIALGGECLSVAGFPSPGQVLIRDLESSAPRLHFELAQLTTPFWNEGRRWICLDPAEARLYGVGEAAITSLRLDGSAPKILELGALASTLAFDPSGALAITGDGLGRISFWEAETAALLGVAADLPPVQSLALDLADSQLLGAFEDRSLRIWPF